MKFTNIAAILSCAAVTFSVQAQADLLGDLSKLNKNKKAEAKSETNQEVKDADSEKVSESSAPKEDIRSKFSAKDLDALTPDILSKSREKYAKRVKKADFDYDEDKAVTAYLESISDEKVRKREATRVDYLAGARQNIIRTLERNPYTGPIKLKTGGSTNGTVALANKNGFIVKKGNPKNKKAKGTEYKWTQADPSFLATMLEKYADQRMKLSPMGSVSEDDMKSDASKQLLGAAILCDWYGDYSQAIRLARKAAKADPSKTRLIEILFLD